MNECATDRRVVITGVGPVSALGIGREPFLTALAAARSGIAPITHFDTGKYAAKLGAEVKGFHVEDYLESPKGYLDRATELAFAALALAIEDANLDLNALERSRIALMLGSATGSQDTANTFFAGFLEKGPRLVKPLLFPHTYSNTAISMLAIEYKLDGPHLNFASGQVASSQALVAAYDTLRAGRADLAFAGGFEALNEPNFAACALRDWLATPDGAGIEACRPFDRGRNGFVLGEGAGILVLEELGHARRRGATIYAELAGCCSVSATGAKLNGDAMAAAMNGALAAAGLAPGDLGWLCVHANGSPDFDHLEALAAAATVGSRVPVSSLKPLCGETLGAAGALQVIAAISVLQDGMIPPTLNLRDPEPAPISHVIGTPRSQPVSTALLNTFDPGGAAVSLVLRRLK